jgi:hypothetical protein
MKNQPDQKVAKLREQLERGEYAIDPNAVADAILKRLRDVMCAEAEIAAEWSQRHQVQVPDQSACSNPFNADLAPVKPTAPVPGTVRPIHVIRPARSLAASAASMVLRAAGGAQTQS